MLLMRNCSVQFIDALHTCKVLHGWHEHPLADSNTDLATGRKLPATNSDSDYNDVMLEESVDSSSNVLLSERNVNSNDDLILDSVNRDDCDD